MRTRPPYTRLRRAERRREFHEARITVYSQRHSRKHLISKVCPPVADQYSTTPTFRDPPLQPAPPPLPPPLSLGRFIHASSCPHLRHPRYRNDPRATTVRAALFPLHFLRVYFFLSLSLPGFSLIPSSGERNTIVAIL